MIEPYSFQNQKMQKFLAHVCEPLGSACVVLPEGRALHVSYRNIVDIGTLPVCAQMAHQYLQLADGDVALTNDPFTGGAFLAEVTLVTAVQLTENASKIGEGPPSVLLALRFSLEPKFVVESARPGRGAPGEQVRELGLHIPPTPIAARGKVNSEILAAIQSHPHCPPDFKDKFEDALARLMSAHRLVKQAAQVYGLDFSRNQVRDYLAASHNVMSHMLEELPVGEYILQTQLETGERFKLHLDFTGSKVIFDFAGTESSKYFHLTNQATFGVCFAALLTTLSAFSDECLVNSGCFDLIEVKTPTECFLNARPPASTFLGAVVGAPRVAQLLMTAIGHVIARVRSGQNAAAPCLLSLDFASRGCYFDQIAGGSGGTFVAPGQDSFSYWNRPDLSPSVETVEKRYPVLIRTIATRTLSGGSGLKAGGHGLIKTYECLGPATLHWWAENMKFKPTGIDGAQDGDSSEMFIVRLNGEREDLGPFGLAQVHSGDTVTVMSAGGGGCINISDSP